MGDARSLFSLAMWAVALMFLMGTGALGILYEYSPQQWYAMQNNIPVDRVSVQPRPHDCEFIKAPIGDKNCHFDRVVTHLQDKDGLRLIVSWSRVND
ncbi:MAG: hypothetical protein WBW31_22475 [Candidatus Sulfotelmatobacter sp.]|jgi:hypothetical protein